MPDCLALWFILDLPLLARLGNLFWVSITIVALYQAARATLDTEEARVLPSWP